MKNETFTSKLGTAKSQQRSRIWLQGRRLTEAGFKPGTPYWAVWNGQVDRLTLLLSEPESGPSEKRVVSGKGDLPIIDITGEKVRDFFGRGTHVTVRYHDDRIVIVAA